MGFAIAGGAGGGRQFICIGVFTKATVVRFGVARYGGSIKSSIRGPAVDLSRRGFGMRAEKNAVGISMRDGIRCAVRVPSIS